MDAGRWIQEWQEKGGEKLLDKEITEFGDHLNKVEGERTWIKLQNDAIDG